jgi:hypothetical protein
VLGFFGIAAEGRHNAAWADDSSTCLGISGTLCRTVEVQTCTDWGASSFTATITDEGLSSTCRQWYTQTYYYYYPAGGGSGSTKPGLL